jgi:plasmid stabilization system protein ParE
VSCPGGRLTWRLDVEDQRAVREAEARTVASVRDAIQKSFPGCRWSASPDADAGTITIEIHRFASVRDAGSWEAAVEWTVSARDAGGRILTQFEANEKESLSEAFRRALERTARGLSAMSASGRLRPPEGTVDPHRGGLATASLRPSTR